MRKSIAVKRQSSLEKPLRTRHLLLLLLLLLLGCGIFSLVFGLVFTTNTNSQNDNQDTTIQIVNLQNSQQQASINMLMVQQGNVTFIQRGNVTWYDTADCASTTYENIIAQGEYMLELSEFNLYVLTIFPVTPLLPILHEYTLGGGPRCSIRLSTFVPELTERPFITLFTSYYLIPMEYSKIIANASCVPPVCTVSHAFDIIDFSISAPEIHLSYAEYIDSSRYWTLSEPLQLVLSTV